MILDYINFDRGVGGIYVVILLNILDWWESEVLNKVREIPMEHNIELEEYEKEVAGKVNGCGSDEVSIMSVVVS